MKIRHFQWMLLGSMLVQSAMGQAGETADCGCKTTPKVCAKGCDDGGDEACDDGCAATPITKSVAKLSCDACDDKCSDDCAAEDCSDDCAAPSCSLSDACDDCSSCDAAPCDSCFCCADQWTVWTEVMFLRRSDSDSVPLVLSQNDGSTLLNANNLEYNHQAVPRIFLIRDYCNCYGWEVGYFGNESWNTTGEAGGPISPALVGPGQTIGATAPGTIFQAAYGTDLHNVEVNLRRRTSECVTWIAGFRFVELQDQLRAGAVVPATGDLYSIDAMNQLYGFQVGANAQLINCAQRFHVDGIFRAGIYGNNAKQTTQSVLGNQIPNSVSSLTASTSETSFVGEVGLRGVYQLTNTLAVYGGYSMLWLEGIALAPEQLAVTNLFGNPSAGINTGGGLFFHGATVGLQASF